MPQRGSGAGPRLRSVSVQDELRARIDRGEFPAGARLPSEPELAAELQVSRATLREALRAMELEGLLRRRQGSGTFVAEHPRMANSLDVNFGVTDAIRAAGMTAGIAHGRHWVEPAPAGEATYAATKHGVVGFTHSLRVEYADEPVSFSAICPVFVADVGMYARAESEMDAEPPAVRDRMELEELMKPRPRPRESPAFLETRLPEAYPFQRGETRCSPTCATAPARTCRRSSPSCSCGR